MSLVRAATLVALRDGFTAALTAEFGSGKVLVIRDPDRERPREFVAVHALDAEGAVEPAAVRAGGSLSDTFEIRVTVGSDIPGTKFDDAEARVEQIANVLVEWLLANANLTTVGFARNIRLSAALGPLLAHFSNQETGYAATYSLTLTATSRRC